MPEQPFGMPLTSDQCRPTGLDLQLDDQALEIAWADGVRSTFPAVLLRRECPCAACRTEREQRDGALLPVLSAPADGEIRVTGGHLVGNYAIQLNWSDGHRTGIFDFRLLRWLHTTLATRQP